MTPIFNSTFSKRNMLRLIDLPMQIYTTLFQENHITIPMIAGVTVGPFAAAAAPVIGGAAALGAPLATAAGLQVLTGDNAISKSLFFHYVSAANSENDTAPGVGVSIPNTLFIAGTLGKFTDDSVVPVEDVRSICANINSNETKIFIEKHGAHFPPVIRNSLPDLPDTTKLISEFLRSKNVSFEKAVRNAQCS